MEPHLQQLNGVLRKPDLVFNSDSEVVVCDVAVTWESLPLEHTYAGKVTYYGIPEVAEVITRTYGDKPITIAPLIVGARGTWCHLNSTIQNKLKRTPADIGVLCTTFTVEYGPAVS